MNKPFSFLSLFFCAIIFSVGTASAQPVAIDMGLSVKWGSCNLGASGPYQVGNYYSWGETYTRSSYSWEGYRFAETTGPSVTKYNNIDGRRRLLREDDAACQVLGNGWRIPTAAEWKELLDYDNCKWEWIDNGDLKGYRVTSKKTGNSIFLIAKGFKYYSEDRAWSAGYYHSSELSEGYPFNTRILWFNEKYRTVDSGERYVGYLIRPVKY